MIRIIIVVTALIIVNSQSKFKYDFTSSGTTCGEVRQCFVNITSTNPSGLLNSCMDKQTNCDGVCLSQYSSFADCYSQCFNCKDSSLMFPWDCIDVCKKDLMPEFDQIVTCLFQPCRVEGFPVWLIYFLAFVIFFLIIGAVFIVYRIKQSKVVSEHKPVAAAITNLDIEKGPIKDLVLTNNVKS